VLVFYLGHIIKLKSDESSKLTYPTDMRLRNPLWISVHTSNSERQTKTVPEWLFHVVQKQRRHLERHLDRLLLVDEVQCDAQCFEIVLVVVKRFIFNLLKPVIR
jgi:hypothetical protein